MWMLFVGEMRRRWLEYALGAAAVALVVAALVTQRAVTATCPCPPLAGLQLRDGWLARACPIGQAFAAQFVRSSVTS